MGGMNRSDLLFSAMVVAVVLSLLFFLVLFFVWLNQPQSSAVIVAQGGSNCFIGWVLENGTTVITAC